ncbi:hypothetical protein Nepgr_000660 [Nepenthes gracilis]|uniref:Uncharacterized protein n=1 Tax=Nepenthes gracilis TaxID=150966 RepID=A0AAD3RWP2_NEPGR|nr:hypothetical protein Nepgr_000660 [Nepenthes gracilis]
MEILNSFATHKRLLNANTTKASARDSKIPKMPTSKQDSGLLHLAGRIMTPHADHLKCPRIAPPASVQKRIGLKGYSKNKSSNATKTHSELISKPTKPFTQEAKRNVATSSGGLSSLASCRAPCLQNGNPSGVIPDKVLLACKINATKALAGTCKVAASSHQNSVAGGSAQLVEAAKPSGLRMPSPSLRFFGEPKAPVSSSLLQRNIQSSNLPKSGNPTSCTSQALGYAHNLMPAKASGGLTRGIDQCSTRNTRVASQSTKKFSVSSTVDSQFREKPIMYENGEEVVEKKVLSYSQRPEQINNQWQLNHAHNDVDKENLGSRQISLKDEQMHGKDNAIALSPSESKEENYKPSETYPKARDAEENMQESSNLQYEACPSAQLKCVSEANKVAEYQHIEDGQSEPSVIIMNKLVLSHVDSKGEKCKPSVVFSESRNDAGNMLECSHVLHETRLAVQLQGVSEGYKVAEDQHFESGQTDSSVMGTDMKLGSIAENAVSHADQCTPVAYSGQLSSDFDANGSPIGQCIPEFNQNVQETWQTFDGNLPEDSQPLKLNESNSAIHISIERKSGEDSFRLYTPKFVGKADGMAASRKLVGGNMGNSVKNLSLISSVSDCNIVGEHSQCKGAEVLHFYDENSCLLIHEELATKNHEVIEQIRDPVIPSNGNNLLPTNYAVLFEEKEYHGKSDKDQMGNVSNILCEVVTFEGSELVGNSSAMPQFNDVDLTSTEYHIKDIQAKSSYENGINESCDFNLNPSTAHGHCLEVADRLHQQQGQPELQNASLVMDKVAQCGYGLASNYDILIKENSFLKRIHKGNVLEPSVNTDKVHVDRTVREVSSDRMEIEMPQSTVGKELSGQTTLDFQLSVRTSSDQIASSSSNCNIEMPSSPDEKQGLSLRRASIDGSVGHCMGVGSTTSHCDLEAKIVLQTGIHCMRENTNSQHTSIPDDESKCDLEGICCIEYENGKRTGKSYEDAKNQEGVVIKVPPNAVPFSDEWLAAIEAAGEEILTLKTGPVQNSPPDRSLHEPGPWSPVKRKRNQAVGPFDCTKFTTTQL